MTLFIALIALCVAALALYEVRKGKPPVVNDVRDVADDDIETTTKIRDAMSRHEQTYHKGK